MARVSTRGGAIALTLAIGLCFAAGAPAHADDPSSAPAAAAPNAAPSAATPAAKAPAAPVAKAPQVAWERIGDSDGIGVYRREVPGSPLIAFKGEGYIDASIVRVASVLVDSNRATEWIDSLTESKIIRQISETETVHYDHIGTPFVLKDRDFVSNCKLEFDPAKKNITLKIHAVSDPLAPPTSYVRGELIHSSFALTSTDHGKRTFVVAEIHADPKGSVAHWIVNLFQKKWPHNTITRLRAQTAKSDIQEHPKLKTELAKYGYLD
ncbi:MAG: START domain-containing protein [Polyangiaceae bacterium]